MVGEQASVTQPRRHPKATSEHSDRVLARRSDSRTVWDSEEPHVARVTELIDLPNAHRTEALWLAVRTEARPTLERHQKRVSSHSICRTHAASSFDANSEESLSCELVAPDFLRSGAHRGPRLWGSTSGR